MCAREIQELRVNCFLLTPSARLVDSCNTSKRRLSIDCRLHNFFLDTVGDLKLRASLQLLRVCICLWQRFLFKCQWFFDRQNDSFKRDANLNRKFFFRLFSVMFDRRYGNGFQLLFDWNFHFLVWRVFDGGSVWKSKDFD